MILFVNLQIVINEGKGVVSSFSNAYAQHMTREADDNCYLAGFGWYHSPFSECEEPIVDGYNCSYCNSLFSSSETRDAHEEVCPQRPHECEYCHEMISGSMASHEVICPAKNDPNYDSENMNGPGGGSGGGTGDDSEVSSEFYHGDNNTKKIIMKNGKPVVVHVPVYNEILFKEDILADFVKQDTRFDCSIACLSIAYALQRDMEVKETIKVMDEIHWAFEDQFDKNVIFAKGMNDMEIRALMSYMGLSYTDINVSEISSVIDNGELVIGAIHNDKYYCHEVVIVGYYNDPGNIYYYQCMDPYTGKFATISASDFWSGSLFKYSSSNVYKSLNDY